MNIDTKTIFYALCALAWDAALIALHATGLTKAMIKSYCSPVANEFPALAPIIGNACTEHVLLTLLGTALVLLPVGLYLTVIHFRLFDSSFSIDRPLIAAGVAGGVITLLGVIAMELASFHGMWSMFGQSPGAWTASASAGNAKGPVFTLGATILTTAIAQASAFLTALIYHNLFFNRT